MASDDESSIVISFSCELLPTTSTSCSKKSCKNVGKPAGQRPGNIELTSGLSLESLALASTTRAGEGSIEARYSSSAHSGAAACVSLNEKVAAGVEATVVEEKWWYILDRCHAQLACIMAPQGFVPRSVCQTLPDSKTPGSTENGGTLDTMMEFGKTIHTPRAVRIRKQAIEL